VSYLYVQAYLHAHQKTSPGSFHDEMILRKRLLEEESVKMLKDMKEKEVLITI